MSREIPWAGQSDHGVGGATQVLLSPSTGYQSRSPATKTFGSSSKKKIQPFLDRHDPLELESILGYGLTVAFWVNNRRTGDGEAHWNNKTNRNLRGTEFITPRVWGRVNGSWCVNFSIAVTSDSRCFQKQSKIKRKTMIMKMTESRRR